MISRNIQQSPRRRRLFEFNQPIQTHEVIGLGLAIWVLFFGLWELVTWLDWAPAFLFPAPQRVAVALYDLVVNEDFIVDIGVSVYRILASFAIACAVAVPLGILMGSFRRVEAFLNPLVSAWRYLPAPSFIPLIVMWVGTGDKAKLTLLFIGIIWFLITLIMDHTKSVSRDFVDTSRTLGASRFQILLTVIVPAVMPNLFVTMRQMMAAAWTYLVIAEIIAATTGIGAMMMRAKKFLHVDQIMAGIVVIGILGLLFDFLFRFAHRRLFHYEEHRAA